MALTGLFTRQDARDAALKPKKAKGTSEFSPERLWQLGEKAVERMNPAAKCRHMKSTGPKGAEIGIIGEAPGTEEDLQGRLFIGPSGKYLRSFLTDDFDYYFDNVCRTMPIQRGRPPTRKPTPFEIAAYRKSVTATVEERKPKIILGMGGIAFKWATGLSDAITHARGRRYPVKIGTHVCWFYPCLHPAFVLRAKDSKELTLKVPGEEWERVFARDIARALQDARRDDPPVVVDSDTLFDGITSLTGQSGDLKTIGEFLNRMWDEKAVAFDYEANCLRPYVANAKILTLAVGTKREVIAFPFDHPQAKWSKEDRRKLTQLWTDFIKSGVPLVAHNLSYDLELTAHFFGADLLVKGNWHDTQSQAYVIDEREGCQSLNSLTAQHFGFRLKTFSDVDVRRLESESLDKVLRYNSADSKWTHALYFRQKRLLQEQGREHVYDLHIKRIPALTQAQRIGLPVDQKTVKNFQSDQQREIDGIMQRIDKSESVKSYRQRYGDFSPTSNPHLVRIFKEHLHRTEGQRGKGYSTDEEALREMKGEPLAKLILQLRKVNKLKGTYIDSLDIASDKSLVYPDGRVHCQFTHTFVVSSRVSSRDPNLTNQPKRKNVEIRKVYAPGRDEVLIEVDQGQIEYRVIGMTSLDKVVVDSCWTDFDVHAAWAERIIKAYPDTYKRRHGDKPKDKAFKAFRADVKNQFTFPYFYLSSANSIASNLEMPREILVPLYEQARHEFAGVTAWQENTVKHYNKRGYVEHLTGRRRYGPISKNMAVNNPVQGDAADIVMDAMHRLSRLGLETDRTYLCPMLNVYDALSFIVPKRKVDEAIPIIVRAMCQVPWKWAKVVPLSVEVSVGPNWGELAEVGKYRSDRLDKEL